MSSILLGLTMGLIKMLHFRNFDFKSNLNQMLFFILTILIINQTTVSAISEKKGRYLTEYACEGKTVHIKCNTPGTVIQVIRANYGRYTIALCNEQGSLNYKVDCTSHKTLYVIQNRCNNRTECVTEVSSKIFEDACPGTPKYLEAHYVCVPLANSSSFGSLSNNDPFGFHKSTNNSNGQYIKQKIPFRSLNTTSSHDVNRNSMRNRPGNQYGTIQTNFNLPSNHQLNSITSTVESIPKIIVPNLPIYTSSSITQPAINLTKSTKNLFPNNYSTEATKTLVVSPKSKDSSNHFVNNKNSEFINNESISNENNKMKTATETQFQEEKVSILNNYNKHELNRTLDSSSFIKSSLQQKQSFTNTEQSIIIQPVNENSVNNRNPALVQKSMLNNTHSSTLFLSISILITITILCLTLIIFVFSRPLSKRIINYINISVVSICMEIILLITINGKNLTLFQKQYFDTTQNESFSHATLLTFIFYYLIQVLFNLLLVESIRIYCNYLLNKKTLVSRGFLYFSNSEMKIDSNLLKYIRWSRCRYMTYGLTYLLPALTCCCIYLFVSELFFQNLLFFDFSSVNYSEIQAIPEQIKYNPQLGLLVLCFSFTYLVLFLSILLIFIAAKGCWQIKKNLSIGPKIHEPHKLIGTTSNYSNSVSSTTYNQLSYNNSKSTISNLNVPQLPQINTLSPLDNSLFSSQLDSGYLISNYTKRAAMKLLIIVLISQTFCWSTWLALCHSNSLLNFYIYQYNLNEQLDQTINSEITTLNNLILMLMTMFSCFNIIQSFSVLACAFHKRNKVNSSIDPHSENNLLSSKLNFGLQWLPICVRKVGASPLPLIGNNLNNNSGSASSSIQQSQLIIQPSAPQQQVCFYSLDADQLNTNRGPPIPPPPQQSSPSPMIKLNSNNINRHHTLMFNRTMNSNKNYMNRDANTLCRQNKHNDYLLAFPNNHLMKNSNDKSKHNLGPFLQNSNRPQSFDYSQTQHLIQDFNSFVPNSSLDNQQAEYEEVMPPNFGYLNSDIVQPNSNNGLTNVSLNNHSNSSLMINHNQSSTLRCLSNMNQNNFVNKPLTLNFNGSNNSNNYNNQSTLSSYNTINGEANSNNLCSSKRQQQFENEQEMYLYESVDSPQHCFYNTRSPIYYSEGNRG